MSFKPLHKNYCYSWHFSVLWVVALLLVLWGLISCGDATDTTAADSDAADSDYEETFVQELTNFSDSFPPAGNPDGNCEVPEDGLAVDISTPDRVVGEGTPESCTEEAFIEAVALGGIITFDCGEEPHTIKMTEPAKVRNDADSIVVIDGEGKITLDGQGETRILYMNTCDQNQKWTTPHCQNQDHPILTVQNLTFINGDSRNETEYEGGGAIWSRGGRLKIVNSRFFNNVCKEIGPDLGGAAVRALSQYENLPIWVVNSTFGGAEGLGNICSNGGGLSSIMVSWNVYNSLFSHNEAIGEGGNPAEDGTPGGGSGGAIYNDGNEMTLSLCGTKMEQNKVNSYGAAIFFVSNNHTGDVKIENSVIQNNIGGSWHKLPGISTHGDTPIDTVNSVITD